MRTNRRGFLQGVAATTALAGVASGATLTPEVEQELSERLRYLSPPDGVPLDLEVRPSPDITPFADELYIPNEAQPLFDMSAQRYLSMTDDAWWEAFKQKFNDAAKTLLAAGIDIGALPVPNAHQRFFEFRPQKFYLIREREFAWGYHSDYCGKDPACQEATRRSGPKAKGKGAYLTENELIVEDVAQPGVSYTWGFENIWLDADGSIRKNTGSPGPTFKANYDEPILVRRINDLPEVGANPEGHARLQFALPSTTTHLHNAHTASESDGFPNDWINPGEYWDHHYGNFAQGYDAREKLTTLWYHDHRMDFTAANVYAGLDGFYLLFDEQDVNFPEEGIPDSELTKSQKASKDEHEKAWKKGWQLPAGNFDIPLILHDLYFKEDKNKTPQLAFDGFNTDGILGDRFTVNRTIQPRLEVQNRKYRLRLLNGGPSRFYDLVLYTKDGIIEEEGDEPGGPFIIITGDGNFQPSPLLAKSVYLGVAQRVDVILDFSQYKDGDRIYLVNQLEQINGRGPTERLLQPRDGDMEAFFQANAVLRFDVVPKKKEDDSRFPLKFRDLPPVDLSEVKRERVWEFDYDGGLWTINGKTFDPNRIDAGIEQDSAEIWTFRNTGNSWHHPIHSHFTEFIILEINDRLHYQGQVQTGARLDTADGLTQTFSNIKDIRDEFRLFRNKYFGPGPKSYAQEKDPAKKYAWTAPDKERDIIQQIERDYGPQGVKAFQELIKLPPSVIDLILDLRFEELRFDTYARYATWTRFYPIFGLGDVRIDRFMGGPRRDVALLLPSWEVKVFMRWKDFVGKHVMHCHNVVHEDHAMMIRWEIFPKGEGFDTPKEQHEASQVGEVVQPPRIPHVETHPGQAVRAENDSDN